MCEAPSSLDRFFHGLFAVLTFAILGFLAVCVLALSTCGTARADEWSDEDTVREAAFQVVNLMDAYQTSRIQYRADLTEGMPLTRAVIGPEPSTRDTALYFGTLGISHFLIARLLPARWRPWFQGGTFAFSTATVLNNCLAHESC